MNKRAIGGVKEKLAAEYIVNKGYAILEMNYHNRYGEIDIIARDGKQLVFIEVKYRKTASNGYPEEAVNIHKIKKICRVADYYRVSKHIASDTQIRFDVIAIEGENIRLYKNAFYYS